MDISNFLSKITSAKWFFEPQKLISYGIFIKSLLDGTIDFKETKKKLSAYAVTPTGEKIMFFNSYSEDDVEEDKPKSIFDQYPEGSVLVIPLKGTMEKEDTWWAWGTETLSYYIREAADHKNITAIIIDVDSGGGFVDSVPVVIDAIKYAKAIKPVIALADMAASAAYYSISPCNLIIASNDISSEFGSIGVMVSFVDVQPMWEKEGVKFHTIYAPESNHKNLPFENALKGDYTLMKELVLSPLAKKFQSDVRKYRKGKVDITQKGILNGKMFFANDAIRFGLADELGNLDYAIKRALEMAKKYK